MKILAEYFPSFYIELAIILFSKKAVSYSKMSQVFTFTEGLDLRENKTVIQESFLK